MRSGVVLIVLAVALAAGIIEALRLRVESNDLLPEYSSSRTDPKGLTVLYESLAATGAMPVSRSNRPLALLKDANTTLVIAGVDRFNWLDAAPNMDEVEALARNGNRVVIAMDRAVSRFEKAPTEQLRTQWNVRVIAVPNDDDDEPLRWPGYFQTGPEWRVLHADNSHPVVIERSFGSGSIVLLASSWPLTNDSMASDRQSSLLADLFSAKPRVVFDESHLGLVETGTVMALERRFHLQGLLVGLAALALLFIWRNLAGFPPERSSLELRAGRDSLSGLSILLARNVPENQLIETCFAERQKSGEKRLRPDQMENARAAAIPAKTALEQFTAIQQELRLKRRYL